MLRWALHALLPLVIPAGVLLVSRRYTESPFGNAFEMLAIMAAGAALALACLGIGIARIVRGRPGAARWFVSAAIALSPAAYFVLWNLLGRPGLR